RRRYSQGMTALDDARNDAPVTTGVGQAALRDQNLAVVATPAFAAPEPIPRAAIAAASGPTRPTVSRLVDEPRGGGVLRERPRQVAGRGRPATPLAPARGTLVGLGLEVSPGYLGARLVDLSGEVLAGEVTPAHLEGSDPTEVLGRLAGIATELLAS